ncbi:MAG: hypothetical protein BWZ02_02608 [Lentisphaerae bacterium ADurb.BinA184]|nr:MAG: hypothetical protein BWZ02_02608 [Lentisphaerae bacterium ADurb.BinA184]
MDIGGVQLTPVQLAIAAVVAVALLVVAWKIGKFAVKLVLLLLVLAAVAAAVLYFRRGGV